MAGLNSPQPNKPKRPKPEGDVVPKKPLQVMHIQRKDEDIENGKSKGFENPLDPKVDEQIPQSPKSHPPYSDYKPSENNDSESNMTMGKLLEDSKEIADQGIFSDFINSTKDNNESAFNRTVDDFDFDEDAFVAALDENEPIGITGEIAKGQVIGIESDGVYVDIGGKAPGFMPKKECGLGVITNLKERFPKGAEVEVLVTREQNADGMVTVSSRALALRKSWDKVKELEKNGEIVDVLINGFNRGGVTCDLEGLRGFVPRSQLENGEKHDALVGKTLKCAFLEVNPDTRKLVLSEKRAKTLALFSKLELGQLVEGKVAAIKPYGFFVDIGGLSGLLHQSMITNGSIRSLREVFDKDENIKALITELDPKRGRIGLNTALLEEQAGEILVEKNKIMVEANERAKKVQTSIKKVEKEN